MARLPQPGGDSGSWGTILNDFLGQAHNSDGTLKDNIVSARTITPAAGATGQVLTYDAAVPGGMKWSAASGGPATVVTMGGDIAGPSDNAQIAPAAVGTAELANAAVTAVKLADTSVTSTKLAAGSPSSGQVLSYNGTQLAWMTPASTAITDGSITAAKLDTGAGTTGQVLVLDSTAPGGFKWATISTGSAAPTGPAGGDLAGTYPNPTIAPNAVVTGNIADVNVTTAKLADGAVTTAKLADDSVTSAKIVDGTITESDLASSVVTKLNAAGTVADGSLLPTKLSITGGAPTNGQMLTYNTAAQKFEWMTPASFTQQQADWNAASGVSAILNKPTLSTVATSGAYTDLTGKPTIPAQLNAIAGTNVTISGTYPNLTFAATPGAGVTDLSTTTTATDVTVVSSTGNDATIAAATATVAGVLSAADKSKLDGLSTVATSGSYTDLTNKPTIPTVTDATTTSKGIVQLAGDLSGTAAAPTVPGLATKADASSVYTKSEVDTALAGYVPSSQKAAANGVATLDGGGKVPASQLPSYVDDVLEYANQAAFPVTGATGLIYVALDTNKIYRWGGSSYIEVSPTLAADPNMGGDLTGTASNAQIAAAAVGTTELADSSVTSAKIQDGTIVTGDIADGSITSAKIADGTITASDLSSSVTNLLSDDIHNQSAAAQVANYYIKTADAAKPTAVIQGTASQTADILQVKDDTAANVLTVAKDGTTWLGYDLTMNTNSTIRTLNKTSAGASDPLTLRSGTTTSGASGNISIASGNATGGNSGDVNIDTGTSSTAQGNVNIGTVAAANVNLSRNSVPVNINGSAYFNRGYTVQGTYTTTNNARTLITGTLASSATTTQYGLQVAPTFTPTGASVTQVIGVVSGPTYSGTLPLSLFNGVETTLTVAAGSSGLVTNGNVYQANAPALNGGAAIPNFTQFAAAGTMANGGNTSGTVNNFGFSATGFSSGAGTGGTVNNHALNIVQPSGSGGTTNNYGIRIVGNGNGTSGNNYAIYNDSTAPNVLVGNTAIGTTNNPNNYALNIGGTLGTQKEVIQPTADAAGVLTIKNAAGTSTFAVNTDKNTISIPKAASDPAVNNGDMYYNTTSNTFRTCVNGAWQDVGSGGGSAMYVYQNYADAPALPVDTVVVSRTGT